MATDRQTRRARRDEAARRRARRRQIGGWLLLGVLAVLFDHDRSVSELERSYYRLLANLLALTLDRLELRAAVDVD